MPGETEQPDLGPAQKGSEGNSSAKLNRRKACDLCFTKKIKCDMLKPICSNCILYHAPCKTTIIRRKPNTASRSRAAAPTTTGGETVEARLKRVEAQLAEALESLKANTGKTSDASPPLSDSPIGVIEMADTSPDSTSYPNPRLRIPFDTTQAKAVLFDHADMSAFSGSSEPETAAGLSLPPMKDVLPVIEHYFDSANRIMPIFDEAEYMRMLHGWYNNVPETQNKAVWAAVQVTMAMGLRTPRSGELDSGFNNIEMANVCLRNAQSVVSELVTREKDLLGIQVLLCIVGLFQNSRDQRPASVLIGAAVRLAHRLELPVAMSAERFSPREAQQRARVFWVCYFMDKDVSLRSRTPSMQLDADIDIPLPPKAPADGVGLIWTADGKSHVNYLRARVELAHIQGKAYDLLYANRSARVKGSERQRRVEGLQVLLDRWESSVPGPFKADHLATTVGLGDLLQMTKMYHAFLLTEVMIHGIYSADAEWSKKVSAMSKLNLKDVSHTDEARGGPSLCRSQSAPLPGGWSRCVEVSRECMKLFQLATPTECLIWTCSCAHFSSLIILLANTLLDPTHSSVSLDMYLSSKSLELYEKLRAIFTDPDFHGILEVLGELNEKAHEAIAAVRPPVEPDSLANSDVFQGLDVSDPSWLGLLPTVDGRENASLDSFGAEVATYQSMDSLDGMFMGDQGPFGGLESEQYVGVGGL